MKFTEISTIEEPKINTLFDVFQLEGPESEENRKAFELLMRIFCLNFLEEDFGNHWNLRDFIEGQIFINNNLESAVKKNEHLLFFSKNIYKILLMGVKNKFLMQIDRVIRRAPHSLEDDIILNRSETVLINTDSLGFKDQVLSLLNPDDFPFKFFQKNERFQDRKEKKIAFDNSMKATQEEKEIIINYLKLFFSNLNKLIISVKTKALNFQEENQRELHSQIPKLHDIDILINMGKSLTQKNTSPFHLNQPLGNYDIIPKNPQK